MNDRTQAQREYAQPERAQRERARRDYAFTLIELIGVLAVIALLAAILVPNLIRQMDRVVGDQESARLKSLAEVFQQSVLRNRYIPSETEWASVVATELGVDVSNVSTNARNQPRILLIDPLFEIGVNGGGLPYTQNNFGSIVTNGFGDVLAPVSPRVLMLSSIGRALPGSITSGVPTQEVFTNIWNAADRAVPAVTNFAGWSGNGDDLKIQRINLSPLFVRLVLTTYAPLGTNNNLGRYSIDWLATNTVPVPTNSAGIEGYFIQNSILGLHKDSGSGGALDSQQVMIRDKESFVYSEGVWRGSISGLSPLGGLDIGSVVDKFLSAPRNTNPNVPTNAQPVVVQSMMEYMDAYEAWAASNFTSSSLRSAALTKQAAMIAAVQQLYQSPNYFPPEIACP